MRTLLILTLLLSLPIQLFAAAPTEKSTTEMELPDISTLFYENNLDSGDETTAQDIEAMIDQRLQALIANQTNNNIMQEQINNELLYVGLLCALCLTSLIIVLTFFKDKEGVTAKDVTNIAGLAFIIFGTIILVIIASTSEQLTAAIGVLGAIAGYLFRSAQESTPTENGQQTTNGQ